MKKSDRDWNKCVFVWQVLYELPLLSASAVCKWYGLPFWKYQAFYYKFIKDNPKAHLHLKFKGDLINSLSDEDLEDDGW